DARRGACCCQALPQGGPGDRRDSRTIFGWGLTPQLPWWPMHRPAAEQMQVDVEDRLPGLAVRVEDRSKATCRDSTGPGPCRCSPDQLTDDLIVFHANLIE